MAQLQNFLGEKAQIAPWVVRHFPEHKSYCEPFGRDVSILLSKNPCGLEVFNDLSGEVVPALRFETKLSLDRNDLLWVPIRYRLSRVVFERMDLIRFIEKYDHADALFYVDLPGDEDLHQTLCAVLQGCQGSVVLRGCARNLPETICKGWTAIDGNGEQGRLWIKPRPVSDPRYAGHGSKE
jgi:hypothetical protein